MAEQVTEADSVLVLTCIEVLNKSDGEIKWELLSFFQVISLTLSENEETPSRNNCHAKIVFTDYLASTYAPNFKANPGESIQFPFKTTHPNVSISVFQQTTEIQVHPRNEFFKIWNSSSPLENPRWSFNSKFGLTLANATIFDTVNDYLIGSMPFVNGKRVNIQHNEETREFLGWSFQWINSKLIMKYRRAFL
ncbi:hypothetical protein DAPPUDRAFT_325387 [Daphnia pulex]|uniref:Uncharacterized protein n=1 Tax=Daphnia pulex TaxID=6669 RepID=E9H4J7_DAPPU|nr:hypothetical protein DAPPUDRAFT_325387 [Daphnia pulex]|eukprot:EFX73336.1 hypothetical protein DAPPUDRAFT_325387 [Daphnia pulex]